MTVYREMDVYYILEMLVEFLFAASTPEDQAIMSKAVETKNYEEFFMKLFGRMLEGDKTQQDILKLQTMRAIDIGARVIIKQYNLLPETDQSKK